VFDAYGTLLDVHSAMAAHSARLGPNWQAVSVDWRARQLEYTWVRSLAGRHADFAAVTRASLDWALARHGIADAALARDLEDAYRRLSAYPDAVATLFRLRQLGLPCAILSNGEPAMLDAAVAAAGLAERLDAVLSIESVGIYKPDPRVYALAASHFATTPGRIAFVSSNAWDAFGARAFGCRVFWINRAGAPVEYGLDRDATILPDLAALPDHLT